MHANITHFWWLLVSIMIWVHLTPNKGVRWIKNSRYFGIFMQWTTFDPPTLGYLTFILSPCYIADKILFILVTSSRIQNNKKPWFYLFVFPYFWTKALSNPVVFFFIFFPVLCPFFWRIFLQTASLSTSSCKDGVSVNHIHYKNWIVGKWLLFVSLLLSGNLPFVIQTTLWGCKFLYYHPTPLLNVLTQRSQWWLHSSWDPFQKNMMLFSFLSSNKHELV